MEVTTAIILFSRLSPTPLQLPCHHLQTEHAYFHLPGGAPWCVAVFGKGIIIEKAHTCRNAQSKLPAMVDLVDWIPQTSRMFAPVEMDILAASPTLDPPAACKPHERQPLGLYIAESRRIVSTGSGRPTWASLRKH